MYFGYKQINISYCLVCTALVSNIWNSYHYISYIAYATGPCTVYKLNRPNKTTEIIVNKKL